MQPSPARPEPTASPTTEPSSVPLAQLPREGLVIGRPRSVAFVGLDGRVFDRLGGFRLYYDWTVPGPVILRSRRVFYTLDVPNGRLDPLPSRDAAARLAPQFQEGVDPVHDRWLDIQRPLDASPDAGFWAFALESPDGTMLLAQWSGECESQNAFIANPDGSEPRPITGERGLADAPGSSVLGWTSDGTALVFIGEGACSPSGFGRPGIYRFDGIGDGELMIPVPDPLGVRMWNPA